VPSQFVLELILARSSMPRRSGLILRAISPIDKWKKAWDAKRSAEIRKADKLRKAAAARQAAGAPPKPSTDETKPVRKGAAKYRATMALKRARMLEKRKG